MVDFVCLMPDCASRAAAECAKQHLSRPGRSFVHLCSFSFPIRATNSWCISPSFPNLCSLPLSSVETVTSKCSLWLFFLSSGGNNYRRGKKQREKWDISYWNFKESLSRDKIFGGFLCCKASKNHKRNETRLVLWKPACFVGEKAKGRIHILSDLHVTSLRKGYLEMSWNT